MKTIKQVRENFWEYLKEVAPELANQRRSKKRQNDYCADIRMTFVDWVDNMSKDGQISNQLAQRVTL
jgi:ABC-type uncharacterized transport system YnjBCD substrate-binding protein